MLTVQRQRILTTSQVAIVVMVLIAHNIEGLTPGPVDLSLKSSCAEKSSN